MKALNFARLFMLMLVAGTLITVSASAEEAKEVKIKTNAHCSGCVGKIEGALNKTDGVKSSKLDLDSKVVTVSYMPSKTNPDNLTKALATAGYKGDVVKDGCCDKKKEGCCDKKHASAKKDCSGKEKCKDKKSKCSGKKASESSGTKGT